MRGGHYASACRSTVSVVMAEEPSLLPGRRTEPLSDQEIRTVVNMFLGLDNSVPVAYDPSRPTGFRVDSEDGEEVGRVYFSADIYPGPGVADPNAAVSTRAAVAHEICHHARWANRTELPAGRYQNLDEAITSLEALLRFGGRPLSPVEVEQLARDAVQRLQRLRAELFDEHARGEA